MAMNQEQANTAIAEKLEQIETLLVDCQAIANEAGVDFVFCPSYGMGGTYDGTEGEWCASSHSC